jgi:hypothetical protein
MVKRVNSCGERCCFNSDTRAVSLRVFYRRTPPFLSCSFSITCAPAIRPLCCCCFCCCSGPAPSSSSRLALLGLPLQCPHSLPWRMCSSCTYCVRQSALVQVCRCVLLSFSLSLVVLGFLLACFCVCCFYLLFLLLLLLLFTKRR